MLHITGNYSAIMSRLDRRFEAPEIRSANTIFQLMTILEEARNLLILVEHDLLHYEDTVEMEDSISQPL